MKILIDARLYGLENAGLGRYVLNLVEELVKNSDNQYLILLRKDYYQKLRLPSNWTKILADYRHYSFIEQIMVPWEMFRHKPDITHFPHFNVPIITPGKFVVTIHDLLMHSNQGLKATTLNPLFYLIKRVAYWWVFRKAIYASEKIIVPCNAVKKEVGRYYRVNPKKIEVTYEGVDQKIKIQSGWEKVSKKYDLTKPYLVYVGNAYPHKNLQSAIAAVAKYNRDNKKKVTFAIATSRNIFLLRLKEMIRSEKAQKYVKLLGFVPDEELGILYKNAAAFIYPSFSEGFGLQGLEVMDSGGIVTASDIGVFKEIYQDNCIYFDPHDIDSISSAITSVMDLNKEGRNRMINKGKEIVEKFSWNKMATETMAVYNLSLNKEVL